MSGLWSWLEDQLKWPSAEKVFTATDDNKMTGNFKTISILYDILSCIADSLQCHLGLHMIHYTNFNVIVTEQLEADSGIDKSGLSPPNLPDKT